MNYGPGFIHPILGIFILSKYGHALIILTNIGENVEHFSEDWINSVGDGNAMPLE